MTYTPRRKAQLIVEQCRMISTVHKDINNTRKHLSKIRGHIVTHQQQYRTKEYPYHWCQEVKEYAANLRNYKQMLNQLQRGLAHIQGVRLKAGSLFHLVNIPEQE